MTIKPPINLKASVSMAQINLTWKDKSNNETGFELERCQGSSCINFVKIATIPANITTYSDKNLPASTTFRYRLRAVNNQGASDYSNIISVVTSIDPPPPVVLAAPVISSITPGYTNNNILWNQSVGAATFSVKRALVTGGPYTTIISGLVNPHYIDEGLTNGVKYYYVVSATNADGTQTATSAEVSGTPVENIPPPPIVVSGRFIWTPTRQLVYNQMLADYLANPSSPATLGGIWFKFMLDRAESGATYNDTGLLATMMYQMTNDTHWVDKAWVKIQDFLALTPAQTAGNYVREYGMEHVIMYNWLLPGLNSTQIAQYTNAIGAMLNYAINGNIYLQGYPLGDSDQLVGDYFGIALFYLQNPNNSVALSLFNDPGTGGLPQPILTDKYTTARQGIRYFVEVMAEGGEWIESSEYNLGTVRLVIMGAEAIKIFTGIDYFPEVTAWLPKLAERLLAYWTPDLLETYQWGDIEHPRADDKFEWTNTIGLVAGLLQDTAVGQRLQDLLLDLVAKYGATGTGSMEPIVTTRLFYTWNPYATSGDRTSQSLSFYANGQGEMLQKSGYSSSDSLASIFLAQRPNGIAVDHLIRWFGDFELWKNGEWALTHPRAYAGPPNTSLGVNSALIHGLSDMPEFKKVVAHVQTSSYAYGAMTTGGAGVFLPYYAPPDVFTHEWTRSILYIKGITDTFIIFDRTYVTEVNPADLNRPTTGRGFDAASTTLINDAPATKQWILHMKVNPTIGVSNITWLSPGGQHLTWTPLSPTTSKNVFNEAALGWNPPVSPSELGYHVRLYPTVTQDWDTFLNTVQIGTAGVVTLVSYSDEVQGVHITRPGENDVLALFNAKQGSLLALPAYDPSHVAALTNAHFRNTGFPISWVSTRDTDVHIHDLLPTKTWNISKDGVGTVSLSVNDQGESTFTILGSGAHSISLS